MKKVRKPFGLTKQPKTVKACIAIVVSAFCEQNRKLKQRSSIEEQTLIGNALTVIEMEIKAELKKLL